MKHTSSFFFCIFTLSLLTATIHPKPFFGCTKENVRIIDSFTTPHHRFISVLQHENGSKFIVKQDSREAQVAHLAEVRDALGSFIAKSVNIPANEVLIIPCDKRFVGKEYTHLPATLHTFVPGVMAKRAPGKQHLYIQQPRKPSVPESEWGMKRSVITHMSEHFDLCAITALDTFIANKDRHRGNFFYDYEADRFYAVDLESAFGLNLADYACDLISSLLLEKRKSLTRKEIRGLIVYQKTLIKLVHLHTPESLFEKLVSLTTEAGLPHQITRGTVTNKLEGYRTSIAANYASCQKLIYLLDTLLERYT